MLVVIPTFNRVDRLRWTLISLMQAELPKCFERFLICIANNHPETKESVHELVNEMRLQTENRRWIWYVLDRVKALNPIDNWYSAITSMADEGEVIFLHGDDDIFLPWSIVDRYKVITESAGDMLLSQSGSGLVFLPDKKSVYYPGPMPTRREKLDVNEIGWDDITGWGPAFIGNHCYRYTEQFRQALTLCFEWCHEQDWLDWNTRTLMLPYYLPFAVKYVGGKLVGIKQKCVIRGTGLIEMLKAPFGVPGWNSGFLALCAYGVLTNRDLGSNIELQSARLETARMASEWFCTFFFDERLPNRMVKETLRRIHIPNRSFSPRSFLLSCRRVFLEKTGLKIMRTRIKVKMFRQSKSISAFLESIKNLN